MSPSLGSSDNAVCNPSATNQVLKCIFWNNIKRVVVIVRSGIPKFLFTFSAALVSRQFVDMSRVRIEGLLAAFPKLVGAGKQHTYVETENVRYLYQPLEVRFDSHSLFKFLI